MDLNMDMPGLEKPAEAVIEQEWHAGLTFVGKERHGLCKDLEMSDDMFSFDYDSHPEVECYVA